MRIVTCEQMKQAENAAAQSGISPLRLMENAGSAAARFIRETVDVTKARFTVVCGRGNNGGDGFVTARKLMENGAEVSTVLAAGAPSTPDASEMLERLRGLYVKVLDYTAQPDECAALIKGSPYLIDAVFGTGYHVGPMEGYTALFKAINNSNAKIFALDMPSGADADTGAVSPSCIRADYTVSFAAPKTGQFTFPAAEYCGSVHAVNIGIPEYAFAVSDSHAVELLETHMAADALPRRERDSNKGDYGKVVAVVGSVGMSGAAYLSAQAAMRCGAGLVTAYVPEPIYVPLASKFSEVMVYPLKATDAGTLSEENLPRLLDAAETAGCLLLGCGLSRNEGTAALVGDLLRNVNCPVVLDADGINALEGHIDLLRESNAEIVITPHPGEMARLTGATVESVQHARLSVAQNAAEDCNVTVVLKGVNSVIATPDGKAYINPTGNPGMARGGCGDVLAGMIAGLIAQGIGVSQAACCGVYMHGMAGDRCAQTFSQYGMTPSDLLQEIPQIFREILR